MGIVAPSQAVGKALERGRTERLKEVEARCARVESKVAAIEKSEAGLQARHDEAMAADAAEARRREAQVRKRAESDLRSAEAREQELRERRKVVEATILAVEAQASELEAEEARQREALALQVAAADRRSDEAVETFQEQAVALKLSAQAATNQTLGALLDESRRTQELRAEFGGLREAVTGVDSVLRDSQLKRAPQPRPRPFDVKDSPFNGFGTFGMKKAPTTPRPESAAPCPELL
ncbi:unnamed protein product [Polarella glacialis]|uniref:Uncharacterized protein n=1 Tax=Polarella glacialis TaxID=89957 RepID=A0A813GVP0_POLGL|nr:unnamed protein product [Polarella glacialis]